MDRVQKKPWQEKTGSSQARTPGCNSFLALFIRFLLANDPFSFKVSLQTEVLTYNIVNCNNRNYFVTEVELRCLLTMLTLKIIHQVVMDSRHRNYWHKIKPLNTGAID